MPPTSVLAADLRVPTRWPALDGVRGLAVVCVVLYHAYRMVVLGDADPSARDLDPLTWPINTARFALDAFFVLSGFLITGILIDARDSERYFVSFYARRTLRIIPLYYLMVFLSYHVLPRFPVWEQRLVGQGDIPHEQYFWLFLANFVFAEEDLVQHCIVKLAFFIYI